MRPRQRGPPDVTAEMLKAAAEFAEAHWGGIWLGGTITIELDNGKVVLQVLRNHVNLRTDKGQAPADVQPGG